MAKSVFREYDQQALDAEYNNREKVADSADWLSRYAVASAETRATLDCRLELASGAHPARAGPRVRPRRLLASPGQVRLELRRARLCAVGRGRRRDQLRADPH